MERYRILKPDGALIIANRDPRVPNGLNRVGRLIRTVYRGLTCYPMKPPKGFGKNVMTGAAEV